MVQRGFSGGLLVFLCSLWLWACAGPETRAQNEFQTDMQKAHTAMVDVQSLVNSNKFAKVRYTERINRMVPITQQSLKKYQGTEKESDPTYQSLKKAFEHYVMADHLWKQDKGLVIVNKRLADAEQELERAAQSMKEPE